MLFTAMFSTYITNICIMRCPSVFEDWGPVGAGSLVHFDTMVGGSCQDSLASEIVVHNRDSIVMVGFEFVDLAHVGTGRSSAMRRLPLV